MEIETWLTKLRLTPNINKTQIFKLGDGFTYLKRRFILHPNGKLVVKPFKKNILRYKRKTTKLLKKKIELSKIVVLTKTFRTGYLKEFNYYDRYTKTVKGADEICTILDKKSQT